ncbi:MAG: response regulator transcription factor [Atopobiaceae bacterium]
MAFEDWEWRAMFNLVAQMNSTDSENEQLCRLGILRGIRQLVPYDAGSFFLADEARPENPLADPIAIGAPEGSMASYENYYYQLDYCRQFYPIRRSVVFTDRDFRESATTGPNDAWGKFDFWVGSSLDCYIASDGVLMGCIALARKRGEEPFGEHDLEIFNTLMPHLENQMSFLYRRGSGATPKALKSASDAYGLTTRERSVLFLVAHGRTNAEIASELQISESTAKKHLSNILHKTGCRSREELRQRISSRDWR